MAVLIPWSIYAATDDSLPSSPSLYSANPNLPLLGLLLNINLTQSPNPSGPLQPPYPSCSVPERQRARPTPRPALLRSVREWENERSQVGKHSRGSGEESQGKEGKDDSGSEAEVTREEKEGDGAGRGWAGRLKGTLQRMRGWCKVCRLWGIYMRMLSVLFNEANHASLV
jgi:hypothetical protein